MIHGDEDCHMTVSVPGVISQFVISRVAGFLDLMNKVNVVNQ